MAPSAPPEPAPSPGLPGARLGRGDLARLLYRLGRTEATGVLSVTRPGLRPEALVLRRGALVTTERDVGCRHAAARLARLAAGDDGSASFDGGTTAYPPGASRQLPLVAWVKQHLEAQVDQGRAAELLAELAGVRIAVRADHLPALAHLDEAERRMVAAMAQPRRLDQVWPLARTPRFRLLSFIHFLRAVGALSLVGVAAGVSAEGRLDARRLLGVDADADDEAVKRAYRRAARALHPDLNPELPAEERRLLEARLADLTAAYAEL